MRSASHNGFFLFHASSVLVIKEDLDFAFIYLVVGSLFFIVFLFFSVTQIHSYYSLNGYGVHKYASIIVTEQF